jgi:ribosome maturation factor RimP
MMQLSPMAQKIAPIIEPSLEAMGYDLVRVHWTDGVRKVLQIMAERKDGKEITVEDCTEISHTVSALLDVEAPISAAYNLEISSPGIDRPLTRLKDFENHLGDEVKIEMAIPQQGRKRFRGVLQSVMENQRVQLLVDGVVYTLPLSEMASAKLVLTDALMKRYLAAEKATKK